MRDRVTEEIDAVIANGNRIIKEAEEALAESERRFAEMKFDPRAALAELKRTQGRLVAHEVEAEAAATLERVREALQGDKPEVVKSSPAMRHKRVRNMI